MYKQTLWAMLFATTYSYAMIPNRVIKQPHAAKTEFLKQRRSAKKELLVLKPSLITYFLNSPKIYKEKKESLQKRLTSLHITRYELHEAMQHIIHWDKKFEIALNEVRDNRDNNLISDHYRNDYIAMHAKRFEWHRKIADIIHHDHAVEKDITQIQHELDGEEFTGETFLRCFGITAKPLLHK